MTRPSVLQVLGYRGRALRLLEIIVATAVPLAIAIGIASLSPIPTGNAAPVFSSPNGWRWSSQSTWGTERIKVDLMDSRVYGDPTAFTLWASPRFRQAHRDILIEEKELRPKEVRWIQNICNDYPDVVYVEFDRIGWPWVIFNSTRVESFGAQGVQISFLLGAISISSSSAENPLWRAVPANIEFVGWLAGSICVIGLLMAYRIAWLAIRTKWRVEHSRCVGCGYALWGIEAARCPECGNKRPAIVSEHAAH